MATTEADPCGMTTKNSDGLLCFEGGEHLKFAGDGFFWQGVVGEGGAFLLTGGEDPFEEVGYGGFGGGVRD